MSRSSSGLLQSPSKLMLDQHNGGMQVPGVAIFITSDNLLVLQSSRCSPLHQGTCEYTLDRLTGLFPLTQLQAPVMLTFAHWSSHRAHTGKLRFLSYCIFAALSVGHGALSIRAAQRAGRQRWRRQPQRG